MTSSSHSLIPFLPFPAAANPEGSTQFSSDYCSLILFQFSNLIYLAEPKWKSHCDWPSVSQSEILGVEPNLGFMTWYLLLVDSYGLVLVGRPLWREDGFVFCICCWSLPVQSFLGPSPAGLATIFYCLRFETFLFVASYDSQGHDGIIRPRLHRGTLQTDSRCIKPRAGPHGKRRHLLSSIILLPSNTLQHGPQRTELLLLRARWKVYFKSLPSNGSIRYSTCRKIY
jgi:hypothetical protein